VHRDIKPDNILIDISEDPIFRNCTKNEEFLEKLSQFTSKTKFKVKIGDFGLSKSTTSTI